MQQYLASLLAGFFTPEHNYLMTAGAAGESPCGCVPTPASGGGNWCVPLVASGGPEFGWFGPIAVHPTVSMAISVASISFRWIDVYDMYRLPNAFYPEINFQHTPHVCRRRRVPAQVLYVFWLVELIGDKHSNLATIPSGWLKPSPRSVCLIGAFVAYRFWM